MWRRLRGGLDGGEGDPHLLTHVEVLSHEPADERAKPRLWRLDGLERLGHRRTGSCRHDGEPPLRGVGRRAESKPWNGAVRELTTGFVGNDLRTGRRYDNRRRVEAARATRRRIVEAAATCFAEKGFDATSVRAIAERAATSPETIYTHFGSKIGVLQAWIDRAVTGDDDDTALRDLYRSLVLEAGWTPEEYEAQVVRLLESALGLSSTPRHLRTS
jgi:hypothetical protein